MAEINPNDVLANAQETAIGAGQDALNSVTDQLPGDLPNPQDLIPQKPEIPDLKSLVPKLPIPSFRKPQKIKVEKPPLPRKLQKAKQIPSKIPKMPKVEVPDVQGAVANSLGSVQEVAGKTTSAVGNVTNNLPNI